MPAGTRRIPLSVPEQEQRHAEVQDQRRETARSRKEAELASLFPSFRQENRPADEDNPITVTSLEVKAKEARMSPEVFANWIRLLEVPAAIARKQVKMDMLQVGMQGLRDSLALRHRRHLHAEKLQEKNERRKNPSSAQGPTINVAPGGCYMAPGATVYGVPPSVACSSAAPSEAEPMASEGPMTLSSSSSQGPTTGQDATSLAAAVGSALAAASPEDRAWVLRQLAGDSA